MGQNELEDQTKELADGIATLIDQIKVKAGLLKLESKEGIEDLSKGLQKIKNFFYQDYQQTKADMDEARLQAHLAWMEGREDWQKMKTHIESLQVQQKIDVASLRAHLAKMEASDYLAEKRQEWKRNYRESIQPEMAGVLRKMKEEVKSLTQSLSAD